MHQSTLMGTRFSCVTRLSWSFNFHAYSTFHALLNSYALLKNHTLFDSCASSDLHASIDLNHDHLALYLHAYLAIMWHLVFLYARTSCTSALSSWHSNTHYSLPCACQPRVLIICMFKQFSSLRSLSSSQAFVRLAIRILSLSQQFAYFRSLNGSHTFTRSANPKPPFA